MKKRLVLSLGSNLGNRYAHIKQCIYLLRSKFGTEIIEANYYETPPWGEENQSKFINTAAYLETSLTIEQCLAITQSIELEMGKQKIMKWGPRKIDIDILFYGNETISLPDLQVPHPHLHNRAFVLVPTLDLLPKMKHPTTGIYLNNYLQKVENDCTLFA